MEQQTRLKIWIELIWWFITALIVTAVLYIPQNSLNEWPFIWWNALFVVVLITLSRYIFLLKYTFLGKQQELKIALMLLCFPLIFTLINGLNAFMRFIEDRTWEPLTGHLPFEERLATESYIWSEMLFFGVGSIIVAPIFMVRMIASVWLYRNRGVI
jgi:FlaA1/EpsC-like NDP-sugar epimerase